MAKKRVVKKKIKRKRKKKTAIVKREDGWLNDDEKKAISAGGYYDSEGVLHNEDGCPRCTSMVGSTGLRCKNFAIPGELTCHIHGGTLQRIKSGKTRIYSPFIQDKKMKSIYKKCLQGDNVEMVGIQEELALLRTLLAQIVRKNTKFLDTSSLKNIATVVGEIRQLTDSCTKAEIKLGQLIDIGKVTIIVGHLARIVSKYVTDQEDLKKIAKEFDNIIWPSPLGTTPQPDQEKPVRRLPGGASGIH
ncbi:MAG: hypothetical protein FVQ80_11405 [Planctomycetes bacterium]|nr:hypothetical protein [Planctomycetota bacterium]